MSSMANASNVEAALKTRLRGVVVIAGVGNTLRADDGAGPRLIEMLEERLEGVTEPASSVRLINCHGSPENYVGPIRQMRPDTVVVVDSASLGLPAGETRILEMDDLVEHSFSTHRISPALFMGRLKEETGANVIMLAVQPATTAFGKGLSAVVDRVLKRLVVVIEDATQQGWKALRSPPGAGSLPSVAILK
jgi:hydrogenase maturation protease